MRSRNLRAGGLLAVLALAVPAAAGAHPGVYTVTQKIAGAGVTFASDPSGAALTNKTQYVVANDGYAVGFTETSGSGTQGGMLNYKVMPTTYRADMTPEEKRTYSAAQTTLQPHATCEGVAALASSANILAWQLLPGTTNNTQSPPVAVPDPYYNYIPWQKTGVTVGTVTNMLGETPAYWIGVVKAATDGLPGAPAGGVDLSTLSTVTEFTAACTALGGTYKVADTASAIANSLVSEGIAPFQTQVGTLQTQVSGLETSLAAASAQVTSLQATLAAPRPLKLTLGGKRMSEIAPVAMVTGVPGASVTVTVTVGAKLKAQLKLTSATLATAKAKVDAQGAALVPVTPKGKAAAALSKNRSAVAVTVKATSGTTSTTASAVLTN